MTPSHDCAQAVSDELKPCPFCGSDEVTIGSFGSSYVDPQHYVQCEECDGATMRHASDAAAIAAWNRRAAASAQATGQAGVPDGWKLVPAEPTDQMTFVGQSHRYDSAWSIGAIYRKMLAAALTPPQDGAPIRDAAILREALQELSNMYGSTWDRVDGALVTFDVERFEAAHEKARDALSQQPALRGEG
ncbi:Lar family restriction alleviation protein [Paraburkholderia sp. MM6662-R1]|uniref:Lar family restriction alleviation protein n=1 Tax=Paraburkholderia sp. MM6662-R1 TaxID=2991066 RepID=UPI003D20B140